MENYYSVVLIPGSNPVNGASITVYEADGTTEATIYETDGTTQLDNPFLSGYVRSEGEIEFGAANGQYSIKVVNGVEIDWIYDISLIDPGNSAGLDVGTIAGTVADGARPDAVITAHKAESAAHAAANVTSTATGNIVATNVDAAIAELEDEKAKLAGDAAQPFSASMFTGPLTGDVTGNATTATGVEDAGGGADLKTKVIEIGDWNMDTDAVVTGIAHGLTSSNIRSISVLILNDTDGTMRDLLSTNGSGTGNNTVAADITNIFLYRETGGSFDNNNYDAIGFNRGWITIQYV